MTKWVEVERFVDGYIVTVRKECVTCKHRKKVTLSSFKKEHLNPLKHECFGCKVIQRRKNSELLVRMKDLELYNECDDEDIVIIEKYSKRFSDE